jgi:hypothetical protein
MVLQGPLFQDGLFLRIITVPLSLSILRTVSFIRPSFQMGLVQQVTLTVPKGDWRNNKPEKGFWGLVGGIFFKTFLLNQSFLRDNTMYLQKVPVHSLRYLALLQIRIRYNWYYSRFSWVRGSESEFVSLFTSAWIRIRYPHSGEAGIWTRLKRALILWYPEASFFGTILNGVVGAHRETADCWNWGKWGPKEYESGLTFLVGSMVSLCLVLPWLT